VDNQLRQAQWH